MSAIKPKDKYKKKNVQVAVRIRPLNDSERSMGYKNIVSCDVPAKTVSLKPTDALRHVQGGKTFGPFDKVFGPESTQLQVYNDIIATLMKDVLDGYNCTVFAYGQTGSGKTYTMEKHNEFNEECFWTSDSSAGIIPRALHQIFSELSNDDIDCTVRVSYIELYNEQIFDLIGQSETSNLGNLRIFDDKNKGVSVAGAEEVIVRSLKEVYALLKRGAEKRRTASTLMNLTSSRSHTVFSVSVMIREPCILDGEDLLRQGKLNLVDLAGSENIGRSGATNIRAREAGNINTSLLTLGRVINALTMGAPHIPYRESKLTRILQDSLGGKTITTIIATISPASSNLEESASTLEYAQRAKNIKNNPEINQKITRRGLLKEYNEEIERLRRDLLAAREKHGIYVDKENYDEMVGTIDEKKARVEELEAQLEGFMQKTKILVEDFIILDEHYTSIYAKFRTALKKLADRKNEILSLHLEVAQTKDNFNAAKQALSISADSFTSLRAQASKLQNKCSGLYADNGSLFNKIDEMVGIFDGNYQKLKAMTEGQLNQFEMGQTQIATFVNKSRAQLKEEKTSISALKEISHRFDQNIQNFTKEFHDRVAQQLDALRIVANEHANDLEYVLQNTMSTIDKQEKDCATHSNELSQLFTNTAEHIENFLQNEFVNPKSSGQTPKRREMSECIKEQLVDMPPANKLYEKQKGLITPKKEHSKRRDSLLDSSFISTLVSPESLKSNLQAGNIIESAKKGRLETVEEEKKNIKEESRRPSSSCQ